MAVEQINNDIETPVNAGSKSEHSMQGVRFRAVILGVVLSIVGVYWGVYGDVVSQTDLTSTSLMMPPVLILTALLPLNWLARKIHGSLALSQAELLTIYIMITVSVILSGMGMIQFLCTTLGAVYYYKTPENGWGRYLDEVPHQIMPKFRAIEGFYKGNVPVPWNDWVWPIALWSGFLFAMLYCMLCINTIVRKQWMDRERLGFPIVQLPLEMTDPRARFFSNKLMWIGFFLAAGLETMNSLNHLFPQVPYVQLRANDLSKNFQVAPWNGIGYFPTTFYPLAIGLGFILAADVSFSCWFFYLLTKAENVLVSALGWQTAGALSNPPYLGQQGVGAFFGIAVSVVYISRRHLKDVFRKAFFGVKYVDDSAEPISYRAAVFGLITAFAAMVAFCTWANISPLVATAYLMIYLCFALAITRMRAVAGPPWIMGPDLGAMDVLIRPFGSGLFGQTNLVALSYFNWFSIEMRCCPMPTSIEGMKMAQVLRIRQRNMTMVMLTGIVVGIAAGFAVCLVVWYSNGAATAKVEPWRTGMGRYSFDRITPWLQSPTKPDIAGTIATSVGAVITLFLSAMRSRFVWWPFNPVGYVLANTGTLYWLWCPFLIAWVCKSLITKYGGIKGYRTALPFFLGLVFGDFVTSSCWALAGSFYKIQMYRCFPC